EDQGRVQVALHRAVADQLDAAFQRRTPVDTDHIGAGLAHLREEVGGADPEVDARDAELTGGGEDTGRVGHDVVDVVDRRQRPGPGVEELDGRGAGVDLDLEVGRGDLGDLAHQRVPQLGLGVHHRLGPGVVLGGTTL